jgi:uncharacterized membrane protein
MDIDAIGVFFRWLHVFTACVVIGCAVFLRLLLPLGLRGLAASDAEIVFLRCRRAFKFVAHAGIALFLISGIYNYIQARHDYNNWAHPALTHALFGIHVLLALVAWTIMLIFLAGREPRPFIKTWTKVNLVILALTVAAASTLKFAHQAAHDHPLARSSSIQK